MSVINSTKTNFDITYKVVHEGIYHYKVPISIKSYDSAPYGKGETVYVCETGSGFGFGISKENCFEPGYYDRDSCRQLTIE
jgi:hypothetical protein